MNNNDINALSVADQLPEGPEADRTGPAIVAVTTAVESAFPGNSSTNVHPPPPDFPAPVAARPAPGLFLFPYPSTSLAARCPRP